MNNKKLLHLALRNPQNLRFAEVIKLAEAFGFRHARVSGSHHILNQPGIPQLINLQNVGGKAKACQVRQLLKLVEKHNLQLRD
jgi:predicted RNA binding protein YcfA (HicA-like mRNA interferase family)